MFSRDVNDVKYFFTNEAWIELPDGHQIFKTRYYSDSTRGTYTIVKLGEVISNSYSYTLESSATNIYYLHDKKHRIEILVGNEIIVSCYPKP